MPGSGWCLAGEETSDGQAGQGQHDDAFRPDARGCHIGELRIRGREAATGARTESEAHRNSVLLVARGKTYRQPDILECPIFLLMRASMVLGTESAVETVTERVQGLGAGLRITARPR